MAEFNPSNLESWFAGQNIKASNQTQESYLLHIEKLGIANALVKVGGNNIDENLVQFNTNTRLGDYGAPVIFGHSILRQFYNPKESNKDRYKSIFSTIMTLQPGDEIKINTGEITYTYIVTEKKEVKPDDDYILAQNQNLRQIKLVTCTPEGTFLRRGVITAELKL
jgi:sortase A